MSRVIGCYRTPGVHAVAVLRFGQWLSRQNRVIKLFLTPVYVVENHRIRARWGIDIDRRAVIGEGFRIGHFGGIVVSGEAVIGRNVHISQGVTIGVSGQGEKSGCPIIGDDVYLAPGAKLFGKIRVGNNAKIGANAVVHKDIPDNAVVVSEPGFKIISYKGNHPIASPPEGDLEVRS
jgi:serine O-acetyltransferase